MERRVSTCQAKKKVHVEESKNTFYVEAGKFSLTLTAPLDTHLESLDGVGPKTAKRLRDRGILNVCDLLLNVPRKYQKCAHFFSGDEVLAARRTHVEFYARILQVRKPQAQTKQPVDVVVDYDGHRVRLLWFNMGRSSFVQRLAIGAWVCVRGAISYERSIPHMLHPTIEVLEQLPQTLPEERMSVAPVYVSMEGVADALLRKAIHKAFERFSKHLGDIVPKELLHKRDLPGIAQALATIHLFIEFEGMEVFQHELKRARNRIVYEEFYTLQRKLAMDYVASRQGSMAPSCSERKLGRDLVQKLPFDLTGDQRRVIATIADELGATFPMRRLLQGDVGSGKTVVSMMAAAIAMGSGQQVAIMAPTDILARQHTRRAAEFFKGLGVDIAFLGGSLGVSDKRAILARIAAGDVDLVIGTHALFQKDVRFHRLGFVVVDEQHKFGVEQRELLLKKGTDPHLLSMTATPIPRSLAHSVFGDLDLSVIREKPPGRQPIRTVLRDRSRAKQVYAYVRDRLLKTGEQAYFVYPMVEASEVVPGRQNVVDMHKKLSSTVFADLNVGLLHGRLDNETKDETMRKFAHKEISVLCATTVVEVGVDVANATLMVIESPEVFGLSQLHQLRGRVGRGDQASMCILLAGFELSDDAVTRLVAFRDTDDGFELSEADLKIRGPGLFLGVRQAGHAEFVFGDLFRDADLLEQAREDARADLIT